MIQELVKSKIVAAVKQFREKYKSDAQAAHAIGVTPSMFSRVMSGSEAVADAMWMTIARKLDVDVVRGSDWKTAETPVYQYITTQLEACQEKALAGLLCDVPNIGKTYAAKAYARTHTNCVYIDCSQAKTKRAFVKAIAQGFGLGQAPTYADMYGNLICYLHSCEMPMVILDEAGDLEYNAFLELKALWNATEDSCGWYMMSAEALKVKMDRFMGKKVGYSEILSRFGDRYRKITPDGGEALEQFKQLQIAAVARANSEGVDLKKLVAKVGGSLRRVKIELSK